jgi:hypothetical protein
VLGGKLLARAVHAGVVERVRAELEQLRDALGVRLGVAARLEAQDGLVQAWGGGEAGVQ